MNSLDFYFRSYPAEIKPIVESILSDSEVKDLMDSIKSQQDKISIVIGEENRASCWNWAKKEITIERPFLNDPSKLIPALLFELHNAAQTDQFKCLIQNHDSADALVEQIEQLEHQSLIKTNRLASKILQGDFLFKAVFLDFRLHYALNQIKGHSEKTAKEHCPGKPYRGTLFYPIDTLSTTEREHLYALLYYYYHNTKSFHHLIASHKVQNDPESERVLECAKRLFQITSSS